MVATSSLLLVLLSVGVPPTAAAVEPGVVVLENCLISAFKEVEVPAAEAGVLVKLFDASKEGKEVVGEGIEGKEQTILGQIDSSDAIAKEKSATLEIAVAQALAESDAELQAAVKTKEVAQAELDTAVATNLRSPGSVTKQEMRRLELTVARSGYEIKVKQLERENHARTADVKRAQLEAVENEKRRRTLFAPISGIVVDRLKQKGEWVQPGETVLKIVGFDQVRVLGFVSAQKYSPASIAGSQVMVTVEVPGNDGQIVQQQQKGVITFVSPIVETSGDFRVWAEIENKQDSAGLWIFRPGTVGKMKIHLNTGGVARREPVIREN